MGEDGVKAGVDKPDGATEAGAMSAGEKSNEGLRTTMTEEEELDDAEAEEEGERPTSVFPRMDRSETRNPSTSAREEEEES